MNHCLEPLLDSLLQDFILSLDPDQNRQESESRDHSHNITLLEQADRFTILDREHLEELEQGIDNFPFVHLMQKPCHLRVHYLEQSVTRLWRKTVFNRLFAIRRDVLPKRAKQVCQVCCLAQDLTCFQVKSFVEVIS